MESALKLSALSQSFGVGDAIKSWLGLFNLFLEANQFIVAENLHALTFSDMATSRELLRRQLQLVTSLLSTMLSSGRKVNNLPFESAGLGGARRVDPVEVIPSSKLATEQERRRAYRRECSARLKSP